MDDRKPGLAGGDRVTRQGARERRRRGALDRAIAIFARARTLDEALPDLLETVGMGLRWDVAIVYTADEADRLHFAEGWLALPRYAPFREASVARTFEPGEGLPGIAWQKAAPIWVPEISDDLRYLRREAAAHAGLRTAVFLPALAGDRLRGVLELYSAESRPVDSRALERLQAFGGVLGLFLERVAAESALRQREARFASVLAGALDAVIDMDQHGRITAWNTQAETIFGWSAEEAIGRDLELIVPPELRAAHAAGRARYLDTRRPTIIGQRVELPALHRAGHRIDTELTVQSVGTDEQPAFTAFLRDITEAKAATEGVRMLAEIASDASLTTTGKIGRLLELMALHFGLGTGVLGRVVGDNIEIVSVRGFDSARLHPGVQVARRDTFSDLVVRDRRIVTIPDARVPPWNRYPAHHKVGLHAFIGVPIFVGDRVIGVLSFSSPTPRSAPFHTGQVEFLQMMSRWVGTELERDQIGAELATANQALERSVELARDLAAAADDANRAKSEFLAAMSHEVRTPLHGIIGSIELLRDDVSGERGLNQLDVLARSADRQLRIVDDLLDFSKIEARRLELEIIPIDIGGLVHEIVDLHRPSAEAKGLRLSLDLDPAVPALVQGDPVRISQIVSNLVGNAIKFTGTGRVAVTVAPVPATTLTDAPALLIRVVDTGPGIDRAARTSLFEPFAQADASISRRFGGAGLGLAISSRLVELMGGRISVASSSARGSTFEVELPLPVSARDAVPPIAVDHDLGALTHGETFHLFRPADPASPARSDAVLVVEDDAVGAQIATAFLVRLGRRPVVVADGPSALLQLAERPFGLVLLDLHLPGMDGYAIAREQRRREAGSGDSPVPIVAASADAFEETRRLCAEAGMDGHLAKPYRGRDVRRLLDHLAPVEPDARDADRIDRLELQRPAGGILPGVLSEALEMGGSDRVLAFIDLFLESGGDLVERCTAALLEGDLATAGERAHTLRGSASAFAERDVVGAAVMIEEAAAAAALPGSEVPDETASAELARRLQAAFADARLRLMDVRGRVALLGARA